MTASTRTDDDGVGRQRTHVADEVREMPRDLRVGRLERWTAILTIIFDTPHDAERLRKNPPGVFRRRVVLRPRDPAPRHSDRVQAHHPGRLCPGAVRPVQQDGVSGRRVLGNIIASGVKMTSHAEYSTASSIQLVGVKIVVKPTRSDWARPGPGRLAGDRRLPGCPRLAGSAG
jgi:hypothetical protein